MKQTFFAKSPSLNAIILEDRNDTEDISPSIPGKMFHRRQKLGLLLARGSKKPWL
jgi:hypothetical protein